MPRIEGLERVAGVLKRLHVEAERGNTSVIVGYTQNYALYVHENLEARHAPGKQAKYLEGPARRLAGTLGGMIRTAYRKTKNLSMGLLAAGLRLQRESQEIVPIDTSALKASAFTAFEQDVEMAAAEADAAASALRARTSPEDRERNREARKQARWERVTKGRSLWDRANRRTKR